jgi:putative ABC transport system substrate-binding protein
LAQELVRLKVELILAGNATSARAAKKATATIPIVVANAGDPIGSGLVASLARPDGNVTGLTNYSPELLGKRLELLKEVVPKVSRFGFLNDADSRASRQMFTDMQTAAETLGVNIQLIEVNPSNPALEDAFKVVVKKAIGALLTAPGPRIGLHRTKILDLLGQNRIPAMHPAPDWSSSGGLMSYGANTSDLYRRAATYVDKILKGAKPADLPVEQPRKFEFVINLKTAKTLNLTIAQSVLYRADKVIK